jgi:hypothetical protein
MPPQTNIVSFVLRFVQETKDTRPESPPAGWHGVIKHVQTNEEQHFTHLADAISFMARYVDLQELPETTDVETRGEQAGAQGQRGI